MTPIDLAVLALGVVVSLVTGAGVVFFYLSMAAAHDGAADPAPVPLPRPTARGRAVGTVR